MNGVRSTYMRKGYLLTALAAAVLLAASSGTAYAQRVTIGFVDTSGEISEKAFLNVNSLEDPQRFTVRVSGLRSGSGRVGDITKSLGTDVTITPDKDVWIAFVTSSGAYVGSDGTAEPIQIDGGVAFAIPAQANFEHSDEVNLVVAQSPAEEVGGETITGGTGDDNWLDETVALTLELTADATAPASVNPDTYTLTVMESDVAPVAQFLQPNFTLSEDSVREVQLDIVKGGARVPNAATTFTGVISVRVSNLHLVTFGDCPARGAAGYNSKLFRIDATANGEWSETTGGDFDSTGLLQTAATITVGALAGVDDETGIAELEIKGCGDGTGIRDPYITLTILPSNLASSSHGNISIGPPLMVSIDSDEASPTLSFSPTDVEIDEGGMVGTVLLAEGPHADDVGMVKLSVEGDAMVSLMQDGEMLEEMDGHVYVDLGGNTSVRLEAMSHSDPDLMDGDMAFKAWKLIEGGTDGAHIGEGSWFKVDVRGSTAVPALPLIGQLLLALFLMAGGARLYRRRQG